VRLKVLLLVLRQVLSPVRLTVLARVCFLVQLLIFLRYPVPMCPRHRRSVMLMTTTTATTAPADASFTTLRVTSFVVRRIQQLEQQKVVPITALVRPLERLAGSIPCVKARSVLAMFAKTAFRAEVRSVMLLTTETVTTAPADASFTTRVTTSVVLPIQQLDQQKVAPIIARVRPLERLAGSMPCAKARSVLAMFAKTAFRLGARERNGDEYSTGRSRKNKRALSCTFAASLSDSLHA
jgi:hypothetical protein